MPHNNIFTTSVSFYYFGSITGLTIYINSKYKIYKNKINRTFFILLVISANTWIVNNVIELEWSISKILCVLILW